MEIEGIIESVVEGLEPKEGGLEQALKDGDDAFAQACLDYKIIDAGTRVVSGKQISSLLLDKYLEDFPVFSTLSIDDAHNLFVYLDDESRAWVWFQTVFNFGYDQVSDPPFGAYTRSAWTTGKKGNLLFQYGAVFGYLPENWLSILGEIDHSAFMGESWPAFLALPDKLTVYRGESSAIKTIGHGLSWSLSQERAEWFAANHCEEGRVVSAVVNKEDILFFTNEREEEEVVLRFSDTPGEEFTFMPIHLGAKIETTKRP